MHVLTLRLCSRRDHLSLNPALGIQKGVSVLCRAVPLVTEASLLLRRKHWSHSHWQEQRNNPAESHQNGPVCVRVREGESTAHVINVYHMQKKSQTKLSRGNKYLPLRVKGETEKTLANSISSFKKYI